MELHNLIKLEQTKLTPKWTDSNRLTIDLMNKLSTCYSPKVYMLKSNLYDFRNTVFDCMTSLLRYGSYNSELLDSMDIQITSVESELTQKQINQMAHNILKHLNICITKDHFSHIVLGLKMINANDKYYTWEKLACVLKPFSDSLVEKQVLFLVEHQKDVPNTQLAS